MKHFFILICFSILLATDAHSQNFQNDNSNNNSRGGNRIEALKIAYLTKELNLSPSEAQRFWPIYNDYSSEMKTARRESRRNPADLDSEEKILGIKRKYETAFTQALNKERTDQFFRAEKDFRKYAVKELNERRQLRQSYNDRR